jgi:hypothetical protein
LHVAQTTAEELLSRVVGDLNMSVKDVMGKGKLADIMGGRKWTESCPQIADSIFTAHPSKALRGFTKDTAARLCLVPIDGDDDALTVDALERLQQLPSLSKESKEDREIDAFQEDIRLLKHFFAPEPSWLHPSDVATYAASVSMSRKTASPLSAAAAAEAEEAGSVDLSVIAWNMRSWSENFHDLVNGVPAKIESLRKVVDEMDASLAVLSEWPAGAKPIAAAVAEMAKNLPFSWQCRTVSTGNECAAFVYDSDVFSILGEPRSFPDTDKIFQRPPAVSLFVASGSVFSSGCEGLGILAACSVHLKSVIGKCTLQTKKELRALADKVVPWIKVMMDEEAVKASLSGARTILVCGDFNLSMYPGGAGHTGAGNAWEKLLQLRFQPMFLDHATTNFGKPVASHDFAYDNALYHFSGGLESARLRASAFVYPVMEAEQNDLVRINELTEKCGGQPGQPRHEEWVRAITGLKDKLRSIVMRDWGDHKPIVMKLNARHI